MTRVAVLPHRWTDRAVQPGSWRALVAGVEQARTSTLAGWDRASALELRSDVVVDLARLHRDCALDPSDPVELIVTWHSSATNVREVATRIPLDSSASYPVGFSIDPTLAGGHLTVTRMVVMAVAGQSGDPLAARAKGSVLWRERRDSVTTIALDENVTRFSTEAIDFAHLPGAKRDAGWQLEVELSDLYAAPSRALRLFVNVAHPAVDHLLSDSDDDASRATESVLRWDVARQLINQVLESDRFITEFGTFLPDSVGGAMQGLFERWLPLTTPAELRVLRDADPGRFEAELQAQLRLLRLS